MTKSEYLLGTRRALELHDIDLDEYCVMFAVVPGPLTHDAVCKAVVMAWCKLRNIVRKSRSLDMAEGMIFLTKHGEGEVQSIHDQINAWGKPPSFFTRKARIARKEKK